MEKFRGKILKRGPDGNESLRGISSEHPLALACRKDVPISDGR